MKNIVVSLSRLMKDDLNVVFLSSSLHSIMNDICFNFMFCIFCASSKRLKLISVLLLTEHHATKVYWGSEGIAPLILWPRH
jgi:hypothetical protein